MVVSLSDEFAVGALDRDDRGRGEIHAVERRVGRVADAVEGSTRARHERDGSAESGGARSDRLQVGGDELAGRTVDGPGPGDRDRGGTRSGPGEDEVGDED